MIIAGALHHINFLEIIRHPWFISAFMAGGCAQFLKFVFTWYHTGKPHWHEFFTSGGMPSGHSALVSALAFAIGFTDGFDAPYAMIAVGLGLIVLIDAITLRREAGEHARLLKRLAGQLDSLDEPTRNEIDNLQERLGHSAGEMITGVLFGACISFIVCYIWDFWK